MTEEQWKPVVGYEGLYEASDHGRVRSLPRINSKGQRLQGVVLSDGRPQRQVSLSRDNYGRSMQTARLVLEAFVGPAEGKLVNYRDGNKNNLHISNLTWGDTVPNRKLRKEYVDAVIESPETASALAKRYGVTTKTINRIRTGETWAVATEPNYRPRYPRPRLRYRVLERDRRCRLCGVGPEDGAKLHIDHIVPYSQGGKTVLDNLQALCQDCNLGKGALMPATHCDTRQHAEMCS